MREIRITPRTRGVTLGRVGENRVSQLVMDVSDWERAFPGGILTLFMERPDHARYNAVVEQTNAGWVHVLNAADLEITGRGYIQMQWLAGAQVKRSQIVNTYVLSSMGSLDSPPSPPEQGYLEQMAAIGAQAALDADRAEAAADGLSGMGARAVTLEPGSEATVEVTEGPDGGKTLVFGIPRGEAGGGEVHELSKEDVDEVLTILKEDDELA